MVTTKRFIAGAVCPQCGELDSIQINDSGFKKIRTCVDCGFSDMMDEDLPLTKPHSATQISKKNKEPVSNDQQDEGVQVIRILGQLH